MACCCQTVNICSLNSFSLSVSGEIGGLYQTRNPFFGGSDNPLCPKLDTVAVSGSGVCGKTTIPGLLSCGFAHAEKCAYAGGFSIGGSSGIFVKILFFSVGTDVRYSVQAEVGTYDLISACDRTGLSPGNNGGWDGGCFGNYEACSDVFAQLDANGNILTPPPPLTIPSGGLYGFAARSGSVTFTVNLLP